MSFAIELWFLNLGASGSELKIERSVSALALHFSSADLEIKTAFDLVNVSKRFALSEIKSFITEKNRLSKSDRWLWCKACFMLRCCIYHLSNEVEPISVYVRYSGNDLPMCVYDLARMCLQPVCLLAFNQFNQPETNSVFLEHPLQKVQVVVAHCPSRTSDLVNL